MKTICILLIIFAISVHCDKYSKKQLNELREAESNAEFEQFKKDGKVPSFEQQKNNMRKRVSDLEEGEEQKPHRGEKEQKPHRGEKDDQKPHRGEKEQQPHRGEKNGQQKPHRGDKDGQKPHRGEKDGHQKPHRGEKEQKPHRGEKDGQQKPHRGEKDQKPHRGEKDGQQKPHKGGKEGSRDHQKSHKGKGGDRDHYKSYKGDYQKDGGKYHSKRHGDHFPIIKASIGIFVLAVIIGICAKKRSKCNKSRTPDQENLVRQIADEQIRKQAGQQLHVQQPVPVQQAPVQVYQPLQQQIQTHITDQAQQENVPLVHAIYNPQNQNFPRQY